MRSVSALNPRIQVGLKIQACIDGGLHDDEGLIEFIARYRQGGRAHRLHETSRFKRENSRWYYLDGKLQAG